MLVMYNYAAARDMIITCDSFLGLTYFQCILTLFQRILFVEILNILFKDYLVFNPKKRKQCIVSEMFFIIKGIDIVKVLYKR